MSGMNQARSSRSSSQCKWVACKCFSLISATSVTLTMLRLTSPFGEGDGRCVHISDYLILRNILIFFYY